MGTGRITGAREVTQGVVRAAQGGAGEAAHRIAAIGAHAGREAQYIGAHGQREAMANGAEALKTMRDFAVKTLWEKPIAEVEEKLRELDLEARSKEWTDEHGVRHPGFDLVKGAEAARIGEQWDAYMARKAKELFGDKLTASQREELSRRTAKLRTETKARLTERGTRELITSNLADIDIIATNDGERNVMQAVANANEALEKERAAVEIGGPERYGKRNDGTAKGRGYFGEIQLPNGGVATEYSVGVEIDGKETEIPTLVPTLTKDELKTMVEDIIPNGKKVPDEIVKKAAEHAKARMKSGLSPFASNLEAEDNAAAVSISDQLVTKRNELIRRKIEGGLGFKSEAVATAEADKIVRAEALETVKALAAAGHYDRARKLVEQGGKLGFDDAAIAKGREVVDKYEDKAQKDTFNGVLSTAQSAVAMGLLASNPETGEVGMEDALNNIRGAKEKYAVGTEIRAAYDRLESQVTGAAEKAQASQYLAYLANAGRTDVKPTDEIKAEPWKLRAFEMAKDKYLKTVEQNGKNMLAARNQIWNENANTLKTLEAAYFQARAQEGGWNSKATDQAYANLKRTWNEIGLGGVSGEYAKTFLGDLKDIDNEEIVEGMTEFWRMLKGVKVVGPKDSRSREASSGGPELDKYGALTDATVRHMDLGEEVGFDTGDESQLFTMTVDEALVFSEQVRYELRRMDVKDRRKSEVVRDVVKKVYVNAAKAMADGKIRDGEKGQELAREFGEQMTNLKMKLEEPSLKAALDERERQDEVQKPLRRKK